MTGMHSSRWTAVAFLALANRAAALADTYAIQARPLINRLGGK